MLCHSVNSKVRGSKPLAQSIAKRLKEAFPEQNERGKDGVVYGSKWGMCNATALNVKGSVIVEYAFMTNLAEVEKYMSQPLSWKVFALATVQGLIDCITGGTPSLPITKLSGKKSVLWLQMMLNKWISDNKIDCELLELDGGYGRNTATVYKLFAISRGGKVASGWYVGLNGIKALIK